MSWRLAKSLDLLRTEINDRWPKRTKEWDGSIGDAAHQKAGKSDHLPNSSGIVTAIDITNDPPHEVHVALIAEAIRASKDPRIKYMIWCHHILRSYPKPGIPAWTWASYTGEPHDHHLHVSVVATMVDDVTPWRIV